MVVQALNLVTRNVTQLELQLPKILWKDEKPSESKLTPIKQGHTSTDPLPTPMQIAGGEEPVFRDTGSPVSWHPTVAGLESEVDMLTHALVGRAPTACNYRVEGGPHTLLVTIVLKELFLLSKWPFGI